MQLPSTHVSDEIIRLNDAVSRLKEDRKYLAAKMAARRMLALDPENPVLLGNYGAVLWNAGEFEAARQALTKAANRCPDNPTYWAHLALALASLRRDAEAERAYDRALELKPGDLPIIWNRSQFRLLSGDWKRGLEDYESRIPFRGEPAYKALPYPTWEGQDLNDKVIVACAEQGVGDTILASRYLVELKRIYPRSTIKYFVQQKLHDLFWEFRDIVEFWPNGHPWPQADYGIYQMSLLRVMGAAPDNVPAVCDRLRRRALASAPSVKIGGSGKFKIGIAWTGNPEMKANEERSIPVEVLLELAADPTIALYSLQVGPGSEHLHFVDCNDLIRDCSKELAAYGFAGTAAMMMNLDLVITVCTSTAHLAGAIGVPCWTLLCRDPYWVWGREGNSPFYPAMRLFRQAEQNEWESVMASVKSALAEFSHQQTIAA
jgi:tetratricopeptide (TPR) repeat protein